MTQKVTNGNSMAISAPLTRGERKKMANTPGLPETKKKKKQIKASFQFFNFTNVANGINQGEKFTKTSKECPVRFKELEPFHERNLQEVPLISTIRTRI